MNKLSFSKVVKDINERNHPFARKYTPVIKFIATRDKEETLRQNNIHLNESTICSICNERITIKNLGKIIITPQKTIFSCNQKQCMTICNIKDYTIIPRWELLNYIYLIGPIAAIVAFIILILEWGYDAKLESYYNKALKRTLDECEFIPKVKYLPRKIIVNSKRRVSLLRISIKKLIAKIFNRKYFNVFIFDVNSEVEQKAYIIKQAIRCSLTCELIDIEFLENLVYYYSHKFASTSGKVDYDVQSILRNNFEQSFYRDLINKLDDEVFSTKIVLNPPPIEKPILSNLIFPLITEKEKELNQQEKDSAFKEKEYFKSKFMNIIKSIGNNKCAIIFIGQALREEYLELFNEYLNKVDYFIFAARGVYIGRMFVIFDEIEKKLENMPTISFKSDAISGRWRFNNVEVDCAWILLKIERTEQYNLFR